MLGGVPLSDLGCQTPHEASPEIFVYVPMLASQGTSTIASLMAAALTPELLSPAQDVYDILDLDDSEADIAAPWDGN